MADRHAQSIEEIFPLIDFCRQGRLEEARQWAESGKPLDPPVNARRYSKRVPLLIAIDKGFFSLASLLVQHGAEGEGLADALQHAIYQDRSEIVKLLLDSKAVDRDAVEFSMVCDHGNPEIIKVFIEHGADLQAGHPIYRALQSHPLAMARVAKELLAGHPDLQGQLDMALAHHADKGSGKVIGLLLWAGARPHVHIKDPRDPDDETGECAIEVAVRRGDVAILKQMHPERHSELIPGLLKRFFRSDTKMLDYLLSLGVVINDKPNGGSTLADGVFWSLFFPDGESARGLPQWIAFLGSKGARWVPDDSRGIGYARRHFHNAPSDLSIQVLKALFTSGLATADQIKELIRTPKMHAVLGGRLRDVELLLDPPKPKPIETHAEEKVVRRRKPEPVFVPEEAGPKAREWLLDQLREDPDVRFWKPRVASHIDSAGMRRVLGMPEDCKRDPKPFFEQAGRWARKNLKKVELELSTEERWLNFTFVLANGAEWKDALSEGWSFKGGAPSDCLTSAGTKLLAWANDPETAGVSIKEISLSHKLGMNGRLGHIDALVHEIEAKAGLRVMEETEGSRWRQRGAVYCISAPQRGHLPAGKNLAIAFDDKCLAKETKNLRPYRRQVEDVILKAAANGKSPLYLFRADTRGALLHTFPGFGLRSRDFDNNLGEFFSNLKLHHSLHLYYDFRDEAPVWHAAVAPVNTWKETLSEIRECHAQPTPAQQWGVSESASLLLQGLLSERTAESPNRWIVELDKDSCEEMGIDPEWLNSHLDVKLAILAEEISEMTPYRITTYSLGQDHWRGGKVCVHCRLRPTTFT